ncbi:MAG: methanogenesis marker 17 protein [Methanobrevibacter sp.]|jgi:putative methanogenesis marker protein 17|nr:methanogenesis marker 17 protein [Candidatus Methanovirga aequatorialis]
MMVESNDKDGAKVYEMIIKQIIQDLQLSPSIKNMKVFVDPKEVVFIMAVKMDKTSTNIKLNEVANVTYEKEEDKTTIKILDENYLPNILKLLWGEFSRDQLYQPDRYTILLDGDESFLKDLTVFSPKKNLKVRVIDAIFRILPEGFRVVRELSKDDIVAIVSTDEMIKDDWILKCQKYVKELED